MIAETTSIGIMVQGLPSLQSFNGSTTRKINILPSCYHTLLVVLSARMFRRIKSFVLNYSDSREYFCTCRKQDFNATSDLFRNFLFYS